MMVLRRTSELIQCSFDIWSTDIFFVVKLVGKYILIFKITVKTLKISIVFATLLIIQYIVTPRLW